MAESTADTRLKSALDALREHRLRITAPRRAILAILAEEHGPFSAEELHRRLSDSTCDLVTVYRCLATMEGLRLIRRCDFGDGIQRYEYNTGHHHHHHLICQMCNRVETLDACVAEGLERLVREKGYTQVTHVLELFGICPACQREKQSKNSY